MEEEMQRVLSIMKNDGWIKGLGFQTFSNSLFCLGGLPYEIKQTLDKGSVKYRMEGSIFIILDPNGDH
jgi:hypothetical protein